MSRPTIMRSIKRNRLREIGADCSEAGQDYLASSVLHALAYETPRKPVREKSKVAKPRAKVKHRAA